MSLAALDLTPFRPAPVDMARPAPVGHLTPAVRRALLCLVAGELVQTPRGFTVAGGCHLVDARTVLKMGRDGLATVWRQAGSTTRHRARLTARGRWIAASVLAIEAERLIAEQGGAP